MQKLRDHFVWKPKYNDQLQRAVPTKPDEPMTHTFFLETLKVMRDSITDSEDQPTAGDRERGCQSYLESVQRGLFELPVLEGVGALANRDIPRSGVRGVNKTKSGSKRRRENGVEVAPQKRSKSTGNHLEDRLVGQDGGAGGSSTNRSRSRGGYIGAKRKSTGRK